MNKLMSKVFGWMFAGLLLTFLVAYYVSIHSNTVAKLLGGSLYIVLIIVELALAIFLAARVFKMKPTTAKVTFLLYSIVSGFTFSSIFVTYELTSIVYVFLITSVIFGLFAAIGYFTKLDLTKIGTYLIIGLFGAIICAVINIFMHNSTFELIISLIMVVVFIGFTAYDVQKIKQISNDNTLPEDNLAIYGALQLYLDFINLFIELLRIFGNLNDNK